MEKYIETTPSKEYALLTLEALERLERKADCYRITPADCELIDHYLNSIGCGGYLLELLEQDNVFSFEDIIDAQRRRIPFDQRPPSIAGSILGCIDGLMERVKSGEKIY